MRIAILASGSGTTLQAIVDACLEHHIAGVVCLVISNNRESGALQRARLSGIPVAYLSGVTHPQAGALDTAIRDVLLEARVDVVVLAGYMKMVGPKTLHEYSGRVLNTHPALLPKHGGQGMFGRRVHEAVIAAGDTSTGVSVHLVDGGYDSGRVIAQQSIDVFPGETAEALESRVQALEKVLLCATLQRIAKRDLLL
ncbi:MAG: phosphoribosylglycinamide formyltransferase [Betaproteobacteria bacterium]|nr:MAG: phosphoribosylglycinamide formyltransferase [Betaproteobacteria bacterium]